MKSIVKPALGPGLEPVRGQPARRQHQIVAVDELLEDVPSPP